MTKSIVYLSVIAALLLIVAMPTSAGRRPRLRLPSRRSAVAVRGLVLAPRLFSRGSPASRRCTTSRSGTRKGCSVSTAQEMPSVRILPPRPLSTSAYAVGITFTRGSAATFRWEGAWLRVVFDEQQRPVRYDDVGRAGDASPRLPDAEFQPPRDGGAVSRVRGQRESGRRNGSGRNRRCQFGPSAHGRAWLHLLLPVARATQAAVGAVQPANPTCRLAIVPRR